MFDLTGKVAVVTGGNSGIGLAMAKGLAKAGATIAIWSRDEQKNALAVDTLKKLGGKVRAYKTDVTDSASVNTSFAQTVEDLNQVDICIANAGGSGIRGYLHETTEENWNSIIDLNLNSVVNTFKPVIKHLVERQAPGKLIINSSAAALLGTGFQASYATTKAAVVGLARSLAVELGPNNIQVNALLPGYVETEFASKAPQAFKDATLRRSCSRRHGCVEDMEGVAVFMSSSESDFMTGHALVMDGGATIYPL
ncbi:MAG: hypothetical protein CMF12_11425 [Idiomarina sp.]|uniref:SDR family NAD(P)-dependent oxidoreductase n=1 Tax=Idiomarina sp. TaxID=1874361 RepID=UPI000C4083C2|nr:SDR family oxidoreductase [Idiomarina sp.]MBT43125.1 hypothetical protein [Idiomarina sp.]